MMSATYASKIELRNFSNIESQPFVDNQPSNKVSPSLSTFQSSERAKSDQAKNNYPIHAYLSYKMQGDKTARDSLKNLCKQQNISLFCAENDLNEGDIDLSKFFDRIHHDRLIARMGQRIIDKRILRLVGLMLRSGVMIDGVVMRRTLVGTSYLSYLTGDVNFC
jgi:hypothetical protein